MSTRQSAKDEIGQDKLESFIKILSDEWLPDLKSLEALSDVEWLQLKLPMGLKRCISERILQSLTNHPANIGMSEELELEGYGISKGQIT